MNHRDVLKLTADVVDAYLQELPRRGLGMPSSPQELQRAFDFQITDSPASETQLRSSLEHLLARSTGTLSPGFMNQLFSGLRPWALGGEIGALAINSTMATFEAAPVATLMEKELVALLSDYVGWEAREGIMVTGGSNANLVGLLMARNRLHPEVRLTGKAEKTLVAYVSADAHYSYEKAFNLLGLGLQNLRKVATTSAGTMDLEQLKRAIAEDLRKGNAPFFIGATAGTTVLGAFDPIGPLAEIARGSGLWLHVDGAWGGSVLVSKKHRGLMDRIEEADSLGWDHHKMLATGLVSSFFLTRHRDALVRSHSGGGEDYIFHASETGSYDIGRASLQCGRRTDAVKTWFAWKELGRAGMEAHVDRLMALAQEMASMIKADPRLELVQWPASLNVCFRLKAAPRTEQGRWYTELREKLRAQGRFMVNIASREGETFVRLIVVHPELTIQTLREFLDDLCRLAE